MATSPDRAIQDDSDVLRLQGAALNGTGGQTLLRTDDDAVRWVDGPAGQITWGPYVGALAGVYTVRIETRGAGASSALVEVFDPQNDCRLYVSRHLTADACEFVIRVYDTPTFEVRFFGDRPGLEVRSVEIRPLLLDRSPCSPERLRDLLGTAIDRAAEPAAVYRLIDRLAQVGEIEQAEHFRARFLGAGATRARVGALLSQVHSANGVVVERPEDAVLTDHELREEVERRDYKVQDTFSLTPTARAELVSQGYQPAHFEATRLFRSFTEPSRYWSEPLTGEDAPPLAPPRNPLFEREVDIDRSYQADLARGLGFPAYCPVRGDLVRSRHGFLVHYCDLPFVFYRFQGAETFYLCVGHISFAKLFLYLPSSKLIVWLGDPWFRNYDARELTRLLEHHLLRLRGEVAGYLEGSTRLAAVVGSNIIGHYFWHTLTGLQYLVRHDLAGSVEQVLSVKNTYLPAQEFYPELATAPSPSFDPAGDPFGYSVREGLLPVHFTDIRMDEDFVQRVRKTAGRLRNSCNDLPPGLKRPLLWITLRSHSKVWTDQARGYACLVNALAQEHGGLSIHVDGMADCAEILRELVAGLCADVIVHDGLREVKPTPARPLSLYDMLYRLEQADACVGPIGSNMVFTWQICSRPSVLHAEQGHLLQMDWLPTMGPNHRPPRIVPAEAVKNVTEDLYSDYDMDWRVLLDLVRDALHELPSCGYREWRKP